MDPSPFSDRNVSMTYCIPKFWSGYSSRDGGKISEQANARSNSLDTQTTSRILECRMGVPLRDRWAITTGSLQNSVCLNEVALTSFGIRKRVQDLNRARSISYLSQASLTREEQVEIKQRELVQLAKLKGVYDREVLNRQLILAKSRLFREYAAELMSKKPVSQTPGIDKEKYDKENAETFDTLVEYLRKMTYHPNQYKATAVKIVLIPKPGKDEKIPLGIPTIKDRTLQALVNLVFKPLVELTSDPNSYGFRPYRDCKMAVAAARIQLKTIDVGKARKAISKRYKKTEATGVYLLPNQEKWILDADIKGLFDNINHN